MFGRSNCGGDANKSMRSNWRQHAKSRDNSLGHDKILKCNFLFSLSPQKQSVEEEMAAAARYVQSFKLTRKQ